MAIGAALAVGVAVSAVLPHLSESEPARSSAQVIRGSRGPLAATNTLFGPTGLFVVPTAFSTGYRQGQFSASFGEDIRGPAFNFGLVDGAEIGLMFLDREGKGNKVLLNGKVTIVPSNFNWFELGVGVIDAADAIDQTVYFVASADVIVPKPVKDQAVGLRVHAGAGTGLFKEKLIGGAELQLSDKFSLIGEWDARNFNGGVRYAHDQSFRFQLGFQHTDIFLGATYVLRF